MKKFFTSALMMIGCVAAMSAQAYTIQKGANGEETYKPGDVIEVTPVKMGDENFSYKKWDPELYIMGKASMSLSTSLSSDYTVQYCGGIPGDCQMTAPGKPVVKTYNMVSGQAQNMLIDVLDMVGAYTDDMEFTATLEVTAVGKTDTYTIKFLSMNGAGLSTVGAAANAVSVSGRSLSYHFSEPTVLTVYTISGQTATARTLTGDGALNLDALPGGVYIYRAGTRTGKFVVR